MAGERGPARKRGHGKADLPSKPCRHCGRPMAWRKKWERVWDEVLYCSRRCAAEAKAARRASTSAD